MAADHMWTRPPPSELQTRLFRSRQWVLFLTGGAYVASVVLGALISPPGPFPHGYGQPKFWIAGLALVGMALTALAPRRAGDILRGTGLVLLPLLGLELHRVAGSGALPFEPLLWSAGAASVAFLLLGSRAGAVASAAFLGLLALILWRDPPRTPELWNAWVTGGVVTALVAAVNFRVMRFIELNLALHEQDAARLHAARFDALTGVLGRAALEEELEGSLRHAARTRTPLSLVVCDIDHFKAVNDRHGHATGDDVLRAVARRLRRNVRRNGGVVGRWGGEEFLILLPGVSRPDAVSVAERLRREVRAAPAAGQPVTASFGVASYRGPQDTGDELFGRADQALYDAKRAGRDAVR